MSSAVPAVLAAAATVLVGMFPEPANPTLVTYGDPGIYEPLEVVSLGDGRVVNDRPTSGNRTREEVVEVDITFSVFAPGGTEQQATVLARAFAMLSTFADYFKTKPNETLGGACREAWVSRYDWVQRTTYDDSEDDGDAVPTGRVCEIYAVLQAKTRI